MYYNDYEDYMRSVLGYSNTNENTYCSNCNYGMNYNDMDYNNISYRDTATSNIEHMYPEIYKLINPMVCRMCDNNTEPVTEYLIEQMTDDIYDNVVNRVEVQNVINLNIGTREVDETMAISTQEKMQNLKENRETRGGTSNLNSVSKVSNSSNKSTLTSSKQNDSLNVNHDRSIESEERETRAPLPRRRNRLLRDLIRILILNRIIRPGRPRPNRPPFRPGPIGPRPPMPGGPGFGPGQIRPRPPMPRYDDYEW